MKIVFANHFERLVDNLTHEVYILRCYSNVPEVLSRLAPHRVARARQGGFPMKRRLTVRTVVWAAFAIVALLSLTAGAGAVQGDKKVRLLDDCDPTTFNAVLGDGACVGDGHTTFDEFIAELAATQDAHKWRNQPSQ